MHIRATWVVRVYRRQEIIACWEITDRTEEEARKEARADICQLKGYDDWTLTRDPFAWGEYPDERGRREPTPETLGKEDYHGLAY